MFPFGNVTSLSQELVVVFLSTQVSTNPASKLASCIDFATGNRKMVHNDNYNLNKMSGSKRGMGT